MTWLRIQIFLHYQLALLYENEYKKNAINLNIDELKALNTAKI